MKKLLLAFFKFATFISFFVYLVSCLTPYISPVVFWPMGFLALGFPYLLLVVIFLVLTWLFIKKKVAFCLLLLVFAGFQNLYTTYAVNIPNVQNLSYKDLNCVRILSWNLRGFGSADISGDTPQSIRRRMLDYIKKSNADVLCLQEFSDYLGKSFRSNSDDLKELGYIYSYKTDELRWFYEWGMVKNGTAIFSKVPIIDSGKVLLGYPSFTEHIAYADILLGTKPIRIFSTHFKSINLFAKSRDPSAIVHFHSDSLFFYDATKFEKLKVFAQEHTRQSFIAKKVLNESPYPLIFTADMNSVPTSYPYHYMLKGLQDVFIKHGSGLGTTLDSLPKTLRIDYVLADKKFKIKNYRKDEVHLSDHFPQIADVGWKE